MFEGDIGSGKSTLLYALEFALFGLSDMKGTHLLSEGKKDGHVRAVIEVAGVEYTVERKLRSRNDDVTQDECHISSGGSRVRLSPSDLKERMVSILGFNEPTHPRAESLVYRYAVFTPQEQMKDILTQNSEDRLHVVRRVLGAQSYQVAAENSSLVERRINKMAYGLTKASEDLEEKRRELGGLRDESARLDREILRLEPEEREAERLTESLEADRKALLDRRDELSKVSGRVEPLREGVEALRRRIEQDRTSRGRLEVLLKQEILPTISEFESTKRPAQSAADLRARRAELQQALSDIRASRGALGREREESKNLISQGVCPTCGQKLPETFSARIEHFDRELAHLDESFASLTTDYASVEAELGTAEAYNDLEKDYTRARRDRSQVETELESLEKNIAEGTGRLEEQDAKLRDAESHGKELSSLAHEIDLLEAKLGSARAERERVRDEVIRKRARRADAEEAAERLTKEVEKKEKEAAKARRLGGYQDWLSGFFRPTVAEIETETLSQAAGNFNSHFQRFFTTLVDDPDLLVRVKEDFSPVFEREGFEQDFEALSGGERTSMALAYRFALNAVIRDQLANQPELIVLDEPTDGFSSEQVYRVRALLDELSSKQVIIVSHEKELESMADHVFRVTKNGRTSTVTRLEA